MCCEVLYVTDELESGDGRARPQWKRFVAAGLVLVFAVPLVVIPLRRFEQRNRPEEAPVQKVPDASDPVAYLSTGPKEYSGPDELKTEYDSALTSYQAFLVRADQDISFLERTCSGQPVNNEETVFRAKSMATFLQKAREHEVDMSEMRRIARQKKLDLGEAPWIARAADLRELQIRLRRAQDACLEIKKKRLKESLAAEQSTAGQ